MSCLGQCWPSRHILPHHAADGCSRQVSSTNSVIITKFTINKKMIKNDVKVCCWWRFSSSSTTGRLAPTLCAAGFAGQTTEQVFYRKIQRKVLFTQYILKTTFKVCFFQTCSKGRILWAVWSKSFGGSTNIHRVDRIGGFGQTTAGYDFLCHKVSKDDFLCHKVSKDDRCNVGG